MTKRDRQTREYAAESYEKGDEIRTNSTTIRDTTPAVGSVHGEGRDGSEVSSSVAKKLDGPPTWQEEVASVEDAFDRSGVKSTWPDDEPGNIGPMAAAMADEIELLRGYRDAAEADAAVARLLLDKSRLTETEMDAMQTAIDTLHAVQDQTKDPCAKTAIAAGRIMRLRDRLKPIKNVDSDRPQPIKPADDTLTTQATPGEGSVQDRCTLTAEEREAMETAVRWLEPYPQVASTLRKLLERIGGER